MFWKASPRLYGGTDQVLCLVCRRVLVRGSRLLVWDVVVVLARDAPGKVLGGVEAGLGHDGLVGSPK